MSTSHRMFPLLWLVLVGCGSADTATLAIQPASPRLVPGETVTLVVGDGDGQPVTATLASSDPAVVTVGGGGVVTAVAPGRATVTATAGGAQATVDVVVLDGGLLTAAGTRLTGLGGRVALEVAAGAVSAPTRVVIAQGRPVLDARAAHGSEVTLEITPALTGPATLELTYEPERAPYGLPEARLGLALAGGTADPTPVAGSVADPARHRVRGVISAAGTYLARMAPGAAPCTAPEHRQLDFWVGSWNDTIPGQGNFMSVIKRDPDGCAIDELFLGGPTVGRSVSFYEPTARMWYQTYVDNGGNRLPLGGGLEGDRMVMSTPPSPGITRITWFVDGVVVHQLSESSADGQGWSKDYEVLYSPAE